MENKIGYAYIPLYEYKELIENNKEMEAYCDELKKESEEIKREYENIEKTICDKIYENEKYNLSRYYNLCDYYHNELVKKFYNYGYVSLDKINDLIKSLVERYNKEQEENNE